MKKLNKEQIKKYINGEVYYDPDGTYLWIRGAEDELQMLGEIRGWGRIQNMFKNPDGTINQQAAADFQDGIGHFVANAVNAALESLGEEEGKPLQIDGYLIPNSPFYLEEFRSMNEITSEQAELFLGRRVIRGRLNVKHGIKCRFCKRIITTLPIDVPELPKNIKCDICEMLEKDEFEFTPRKTDLIDIYEYNSIELKPLKNPE